MKLQLKEGVSPDELITMNLSVQEQEELVWIEQNEFEFKGNRFDVVRKYKDSKACLIVQFISDVKENQLFATLGQTISKQLSGMHKDSPVDTWFKILQLPIIGHQTNSKLLLIDAYDLDLKQITFYKEHRSGKHSEVLCPPPNA